VRYWHEYGGWPALFTSLYFWSAFVATGFCHRLWLLPGWWNLSIAIVPASMGFSLAAFAVLFALNNQGFLQILVTKPDEKTQSAFANVATAFVHFLLVQFLALIVSIMCEAFNITSHEEWIAFFAFTQLSHESLDWLTTAARFSAWGGGFFLMVYSVFCGLAAILRIYSLIGYFERTVALEKEKDSVQDNDQQNRRTS
jgi:hypothetical protein